jgi:hypothetical protein
MNQIEVNQIMKQMRPILCALATTALMAAGCQSEKSSDNTKPAGPASPASASAPAAPAVSPATPPQPVERKIIRIKAGVSSPVTDSAGNVWLPDQGFEGGEVVERPDLEIANTKDQVIYRAERYSMDSFSWPVPNGKYQVKLHFAETFEGITGPGQRVFSFNVQGQEFKDFDVWKKAGGPLKAYVEAVNVEATNGKLVIKFTPNIENPQINGIEIIPAT